MGSATAAGLSLLSRAYRGHGDGELSGSPMAHVPVLAPHAEESDVRPQAHRSCRDVIVHGHLSRLQRRHSATQCIRLIAFAPSMPFADRH